MAWLLIKASNLIAAGVILVIVGAAIAYIVREKRKGVRCIGCSSNGCGCHEPKKTPSQQEKQAGAQSAQTPPASAPKPSCCEAAGGTCGCGQDQGQ